MLQSIGKQEGKKEMRAAVKAFYVVSSYKHVETEATQENGAEGGTYNTTTAQLIVTGKLH